MGSEWPSLIMGSEWPLTPVVSRVDSAQASPSICGRAARLWTDCTQLGDCLSHSPFQQTYERAVGNAYASLTL